MIGDILADLGKETAGRLAKTGAKTGFVELNVTDDAQWEKAVAATVATLGGYDILINNAGIEITSLVSEVKAEDVRRMCDVNIVGTVLGMKHAFRAMRRKMPDLRLVVGNPGYKIRKSAVIDGVEYLGPQPQERMHAQVRTALCTFFPNFVIPETFGLVFAESNAVGTPVLTHDCGAAAEVIGDPNQILPVTGAQRAYEAVLAHVSPQWRSGPASLAASFGLFDSHVERVRAWRSGARPHTAPDPRFRLAAVTEKWRALLAC